MRHVGHAATERGEIQRVDEKVVARQSLSLTHQFGGLDLKVSNQLNDTNASGRKIEKVKQYIYINICHFKENNCQLLRFDRRRMDQVQLSDN